MKIFEFSRNIIDKIINELREAEEFIRIAIFQLHNQRIFTLLNEKLSEGVRIEIFTLPYDGINKDSRAVVTELFNNLKLKGAILHFCKWNVGDPEKTTTAIGRWYSFHGKFIVTDKSSIALSANLIQNEELDALIIFKNDSDKVEEYNRKFDELIELYVQETSGYNGTIRQKIIETDLPDILSVFDLPPVIETEMHRNHWVQHYPSSLCPDDVPIEDKLYLTPFDCRGRNFITKLISKASEFVYLSTESFTDPSTATDSSIADVLKKIKLRGLDIRVLSGALSVDFTDSMQNMFRELLACGIKIKTINGIHAKLIITDKYLAVTSVNLNKMNLGFRKGSKFWRENTESISITSDREILSLAKSQYLNVYDSATDTEAVLAEKIEYFVGKMFTKIFGLRSRAEVKKIFAQLIVRNEIQSKKLIIDIGKITARLMRHFNRNTVEKNDFLSSLILYYLSERKHNFDQINEKLNILCIEIDLNALLSTLVSNNFIEKVEDFYKINLEKLF